MKAANRVVAVFGLVCAVTIGNLQGQSAAPESNNSNAQTVASNSSVANGPPFASKFLAAPIPPGVAVIQKMHDRYASSWYSSLSFTELAEQRSEDGKVTTETWWEELKLPGRLRIDVGVPPDSDKPRRIIIFADDSEYEKRPGQPVQRTARKNLLLILGFDVYRQPVDRTVAQLTSEGFDLSKVRSDTWHGRPAMVVGGEEKQFWIDTERQVFVRLIEGSTEAWFDQYRPLAGGWVAAEVGVTVKGVMRLHEVYSNIKANVPLPDALFDPTRLH